MRISCPAFRVYLGNVRKGDAEAMASYSNDYEISSKVPNMPFPYNIEHALSFIEFAELRYEERSDLHMAVRLQSGEFIGMCAIANIDNVNMKAEIGYWIGRKHWGNGYGKEAVRLIIGFGFTELRLNKICAKVLPNNERSIKLLESLGFKREGIAREDVFHMGKFVDDISFGILISEYHGKDEISVEGYA